MTVQHYWAPTELPAALEHLRGGDVTVMAGGTDLMPQSHAGRVTLKSGLLNINRIDALRTIEPDGNGLRIGALVTISSLMRHALVQQHAAVLCEAADHFASDQLRNAATLGGNICNASPAGDTLPPLLVLDAQVELCSQPNGRTVMRRVPLAEFFTGPGRTVRAPHELVCAVWLPTPPAGFAARFYKAGTRPALDISTVSIALGGVATAAGSSKALTQARVAFGAVGPTPVRGRATEAALEGCPLDAAAIERIAGVARDEVKPIDDVRATAWYRKELIFNITQRMLGDVASN